MDAFVKVTVETSILMVVAITVTYLTVLHWHLHIALVILAMVFVGLLTSILEKWAFTALFETKAHTKPALKGFTDTLARLGALFVVLAAQYYIIRKRFDLKERMFILGATVVSADFFKSVLSSLETRS
jgi:hypothetical protein